MLTSLSYLNHKTIGVRGRELGGCVVGCGGGVVGWVAFGTGEGLLRYGICVPCSKRPPGVRDAFSEAFGVKNRLLRYGRDIRYRKRPPTVRKRYSVRKTGSYGTRRIFRGIRCKKQAYPVQKGYSVPKTAFSGTRRIFSARNGLREEASKHKKRVLIKVYQDFLEYTLLFKPQNYWSAWQDSSGKSFLFRLQKIYA